MLPLVALAVFISWFLYFRKKSDPVLPRYVKWILGGVRIISLTIIGLLAISPWIRTSQTITEKPVFLVFRDNSHSMQPLTDTAATVAHRNEILAEIADHLGSDYVVREYLFGEETRPGSQWNYLDELTNPEELFEYVRGLEQVETIGGLLIATDGVVTRGKDFPDASRQVTKPVYILGTGDSTLHPDIRIDEVIANEWVRKNSLFQVRVYFHVDRGMEQGVTIRLHERNRLIESKPVPQPSQSQGYIDFEILAPEQGTMLLEASVIAGLTDKNTDNNEKSFQVKVIGKDARVLAVYSAPHPDINALGQALSGSPQIRFEKLPVSDFTVIPAECDLIILHNLPSLKDPLKNLLVEASTRQIPVLFIIGGQTYPLALNVLDGTVQISGHRREPEAVSGVISGLFSAFILPERLTEHVEAWPPLEVTFESFSGSSAREVLLTQKIRSIELNEPLIYLSKSPGGKLGIIAGEGIWRWRLHDYLEFGDHIVFDDLFSGLIQYLLNDEDGNRFTIDVQEGLTGFSPIRVNARLRNPSLELVNDPDVTLTVTDSAGQKSEYKMGRVGKFYELMLTGFPEGEYQYVAETELGIEKFRQQGSMLIQKKKVEQLAPVSDFSSLRLVSRLTGGRFFTESEGALLVEEISKMKPADIPVRTESKWYELINLQWILGILILLLSLEWFLRRWFGTR